MPERGRKTALKRLRKHRKWVPIVGAALAAALIGSGTAVNQAQLLARRQLPAYLATRIRSATGRGVAIGKVYFWPLGAFTLDNFQVLPLPDEAAPPVTVDQVRAYVSWWDLLFHHRLRVTALHLDRAHLAAVVDLRKPPEKQVNAGAEVLKLRELGIRQLGVHKATVDVTTVLRTGARQSIGATGVELVTDLRPASFGYRLQAGEWQGLGLTARDIQLTGSGDEQRITVDKSKIAFQGGTVAASGTYAGTGGDVAMHVQVRDLPIGGLTAQLGVPKEWNFKGALTGTMDLSAVSGELKRLNGKLALARGSVTHARAVLPWTAATADVDWSPRAALLRNIRVDGDGLTLRGSADVRGDPREPLSKKPFAARGTVEATRADAVTRLAEVVAFSTPLKGQWNVERARVDFRALGTAGNLQDSYVTGKLAAEGFRLRPTRNGRDLVVRSIRSNVERYPSHLHLTNVEASAEGLEGRGDLTVRPGSGSRVGSFQAQGRVFVTNLATIQSQIPESPVWKWLGPVTPTSRGTLTLAAAGPTATPEKVHGSGTFRFQQFSATVPVGRDRWEVPIRSLTGNLALRDNRLAVSKVALASDLFTGGGNAVVHNVTRQGTVTGTFRMASDRWAELPPLKGRVPAGLSGGRLTLAVTAPENFSLRGGKALTGKNAPPIEGALDLRGATYRVTVHGTPKTVAVQDASGRFRLAGDRLAIRTYRVLTPHFRTSGSGSGRRLPSDDWSLKTNGVMTTADAGAFMRWLGSTALSGGKLDARYSAALTSDRPEDAAVTARVRLTDAQPVLPADSLPFPGEESHINSLTGLVRSAGGKVRFSDLVWKAPRFTVTGSGSLNRNAVEARIRLATPEWRRLAGEMAKALPVSGGRLVLTSHLRGDLRRLKEAPVDGTLRLTGARLDNKPDASVPLEGGSVDLQAAAHGTLGKLVTANLGGSFQVRDVTLRAMRAGARATRIALARGRFQKSGTRVTLSDLVAQTPGARLTGSGELRGVGTKSPSHDFRFAASGRSLADLLPALAPIPGSASGGRFNGTLTLDGTSRQPIAHMEGRAEVKGGEWTPPGQQTALRLEHARGHFVRTGSEATIDAGEVAVEGGSATFSGRLHGLNTPAAMTHDFRVTWRLEDASGWASRFFPIPGGFTGGRFSGQAKIAGSRKNPAERGSGRFEVTDAGFWPPQRVLGGPIRPISVRRAAGTFTRSGRTTRLEALNLDTSVGTATATVSAADGGSATVEGRGEVTRLQALVDLWPAFDDRVKGGRGEMRFSLHGPLKRPARMAGTIDLVGRDGVLTVEDVDPLYATHPFDELSTRLALPGDGRVFWHDVKMRGPKANLDGEGLITADGKVTGKGKAWFTEKYTRQLIKPKFLRPVARLVGFKRVKSDFKLDGTLAEARLHMGITKSLLWKVAIKNKVPAPLRKIATGDAPLWSGDAFTNVNRHTASTR
jgi:hypothetical protein